MHVLGVEPHNTLGNGERYHTFLCKIFNKVRDNDTRTDDHHTLHLSLKAMNDFSKPPGLSRTLLVFVFLRRISVRPPQLPDQRTRIRALKLARDEMVKLIATER